MKERDSSSVASEPANECVQVRCPMLSLSSGSLVPSFGNMEATGFKWPLVCCPGCRTTLWKEGLSSQHLLFCAPESLLDFATKSTRNQKLRLQGQTQARCLPVIKAVAVRSTPRSSGGNADLTFQTRESVDRLFILTENTVLSFRTDLSVMGDGLWNIQDKKQQSSQVSGARVQKPRLVGGSYTVWLDLATSTEPAVCR